MVKVVIIDDGIWDTPIQSQVTHYYVNNNQVLACDMKINSITHGTLCARLLEKECGLIKIVSIKVLNKNGTSTVKKLETALRWCYMQDDIVLINMSLGFPAMGEYANVKCLCEKLHDKGIIMVAAQGNQLGEVSVPAEFQCVISAQTYEKKKIDKIETNCNVKMHCKYIEKTNSFACAQLSGEIVKEIKKNKLKTEKIISRKIDNEFPVNDYTMLENIYFADQNGVISDYVGKLVIETLLDCEEKIIIVFKTNVKKSFRIISDNCTKIKGIISYNKLPLFVRSFCKYKKIPIHHVSRREKIDVKNLLNIQDIVFINYKEEVLDKKIENVIYIKNYFSNKNYKVEVVTDVEYGEFYGFVSIYSGTIGINRIKKSDIVIYMCNYESDEKFDIDISRKGTFLLSWDGISYEEKNISSLCKLIENNF